MLQWGTTRFRTYNNQFDAGVVVLPRFTASEHFCAPKHTKTTILKPPDPGDDKSFIPLRMDASVNPDPPQGSREK